MNKPKKLTPRQWRLHNYMATTNGRRVTKREIFDNVEGYEWHENSSDKCPSIRADQYAINCSYECDSLIVFKNQCYYLATREEVEEFIQRKKRTISRASRENYYLRRKLAMDGQYKLLNNQGNELRDGNEEYHETTLHKGDKE